MQLKDKIGIFINCRDNPVKAPQGVKTRMVVATCHTTYRNRQGHTVTVNEESGDKHKNGHKSLTTYRNGSVKRETRKLTDKIAIYC